VETVEQLNFLRLHKCDEVQGFYLSQPLPAEALIDFVRTQEKMMETKRAVLV